MKKYSFTFGEKALFLYFFVFYFAPLLINGFFIDVKIKYNLSGDLNFGPAALFSVFYFIIIIFLRKTVNCNLKINMPFRSFICSPKTVTAIFILYLLASIQFNLNFETNFRHKSVYAESGLIPIVTFSLKAAANAYIFASLSKNRIILLKNYHYFIAILSLYFSFTGSGDAIFAVLCLYGWLCSSKTKLLVFLRNRFAFLGFPLVVLFVPVVLFGGMANKMGFADALEYFRSGGIEIALNLYTNRTFYHTYTLAYHLNNFVESLSLFIASFDIVSFQTIRRVVVLFGQTMPNETLPSVNRLNFLLISDNNTLSRAGASPGLLGSMMFMPGVFFSLPTCL